MSDTEFDPAEFKGLKDRLDTLAKAVEDLAKASSKPEEKKAEEKVDAAEDALAAYAKAHNISRDDAEQAMNELQRKNRHSEIREIIKGFSAEDWDEIFPPDKDDGAASGEGEGKPDEPPNPGQHWTEKKLFAK